MLRYGLSYLLCLTCFFAKAQIALEADPFAASFFARNITSEELKEQLNQVGIRRV